MELTFFWLFPILLFLAVLSWPSWVYTHLAQRIEFSEVTIFGALTACAKQRGHDEDGQELRSIRAGERRADERLTQLAEHDVNPTAA